MTEIPFRAICEKALPHTESLCRRWLPTGRRSGNWWIANCPWREDSTASLGVSLTTGHFKDFGNAHPGKEGGDLIRLFSCIYGWDMVDSADAVARLVGHEFRKRRAG